MKICDLVQFHSELSGGVKRYVFEKMRYFGHRPDIDHVVIVPARDSARRTQEGSTLYEVASPPLPGSRSYRVLMSRGNINAILDAERPDVLEVDDPYLLAWIASRSARRLGIPIVSFYHSDYPRALGRTVARVLGPPAGRAVTASIEAYLVRLYNRMNATVVASRKFLALLEGIGIEGLRYIPLGTDTQEFAPRESRARIFEELGLQPDQRLLLFVGRLAREKHTRQLIRMMDHLRGGAPRCHLAIVGDGELRRYVWRKSVVMPDVTWLAYCHSSERLADLYAAADLLVHPGTAETFGLVSVEAQACGTRVIAVRGGGMEETLDPADAHVQAASEEAGELADAVRRALVEPDTPATRARRRRHVIDHFAMQSTFSHLEALYRGLCGAEAGEA